MTPVPERGDRPEDPAAGERAFRLGAAGCFCGALLTGIAGLADEEGGLLLAAALMAAAWLALATQANRLARRAGSA